MSSAAPMEVNWSRRRWVALTLLGCALQVALAAWLAGGKQTDGPLSTPPVVVRLGVDQTNSPVPRGNPVRPDPTLFALVSPQGFSGAAWLKVAPQNYALTNALQPFECLELAGDDLAADYSEFVNTTLLPDDVALDSVPPTKAELTLTAPLVAPGTVVRVGGALVGRALLPAPSPPQHPEALLTNTVVRVLVDRLGASLSVALLSSSGVPAADRAALRYATAARFAPLPSGHTHRESGMVFGTLTFQWAAVRWEPPPMAAAR